MFSKIKLPLVLVALQILSSCGKSEGFSIDGNLVSKSFVYVGNYSSGSITMAEINEDGTFKKTLNSVLTGSSYTNINDLGFIKNSMNSGTHLFASFYNSKNLASYSIESLRAVYPSNLTQLGSTSEQTGTALSVTANGKFIYSVNSFTSVNNLVGYSINSSTGAMTTIATYSAKNNPSSVVTTPNSQFLYVANQASNDISQFSINATTGALTSLGSAVSTVGAAPVHLSMAPSGSYLYSLNQTAKTISQFSINSATGALTLVSSSTPVGNGAMKIAQDSAGRFLYVTNTTDHTISAFTINSTTGALTAVTGSPFVANVTGNQLPLGVKVDPSGQFLIVSWRTQGEITSFRIDQATGSISEISGSSLQTGGEPRSIEVLDLKEQG